VGDEALADDGALSREDGEDSLGDARLEGQLAEADGGQRRELGRLEDDRVARGQGRTEAPAGNGHREVPRHDDRDDPERLLEGHIEAAGDRDLSAEEPLRRCRVIAQDADDISGLPPGVADRVPGVLDLELGQLLGVRLDNISEATQEHAPVCGCHLAPTRTDLDSPRNGRVGLLDS